MQLLHILLQDLSCLRMLLLHDLHHHVVDLRLGLRGACQAGISAEILVGHNLHGHHIELVGHTEAGNHGTGQLRCLLYIIGGSGGDLVEDQLLCRTSAGQGSHLVQDLRLVHQIMLILIHLHGVAESPAGTRDDGDLGHRRGVGLHGCNQGMSHLVVADHQLLLVGEDLVLLLIACDDNLNGFHQVVLLNHLPSLTDSLQCGFIYDICKLRTGSTGCSLGDGIKVHILGDTDLLRVYPEDIHTTLKVRKLHGNPAVKPSRTQQRRVQRLRTVGGCKDHNACISFEAVHLGKQLVQGLLPLIIGGKACVSLLTDGIDLIDENDTGSLLLCLLEQVTDLGCTHTYEHLHELGAGNGEEGNIRLSCHGLGQHGLTGTRRAHKQCTLRKGCTDLGILLRIMKVAHDLGQQVLRLLFARNILETDVILGLHIDPAGSLAPSSHGEGQHVRVVPHFLGDPPHDEAPYDDDEKDLDTEGDAVVKDRVHGLHDLCPEGCARLIQALVEIRILHESGLEHLSAFVLEDDLAGGDGRLLDLLLVDHFHEDVVSDLRHLLLHEPVINHDVHDAEDNQKDQYKWYRFLTIRSHFLHVYASCCQY